MDIFYLLSLKLLTVRYQTVLYDMCRLVIYIVVFSKDRSKVTLAYCRLCLDKLNQNKDWECHI